MTIEQHIEGLRAERSRVYEELQRVRAKEKDLEGQLARLDDGISVLTGKPRPSGGKRKRGVTKADVISEIEAVVASSPELLKDARLQAVVGERLKARGHALTGFPLRFRQAMASVENCQLLSEATTPDARTTP